MKQFLLTAGDPAGIGYEICLKLLDQTFSKEPIINQFQKQLNHFFTLSVIGSKVHFDRLIDRWQLPFEWIDEKGVLILRHLTNQKKYFFLICVLPLETQLVDFGKRSLLGGKIALISLETSLNLLKKNNYHGVITAPVNKKAIYLFKSNFKDQTAFYEKGFKAKQVSMCFLSSFFNLILITTHVSIKNLPKALTPKKIKTSLLNALHLKTILKTNKPIGVMGFNPHAGEEGLFGKEERLLLKEIGLLQKKGFEIEGPLCADSAFGLVRRGRYDVVVACYHDQGLIPFKMLAQGESVHVTMGLPIVRTSVDHGTAYDIAGKYQAKATSLALAILKAKDLVSF